ncbi:hypothetical protein [uncultured Duncaniella sp.]|uniref:hypothetical protein n=1 Tax=uncultured Duncaniella sp. TaxID=2768039 RepID=UPI0025B1F099|nr:hypothetical protein [uncultured Duncaniella sp.]
MAQPHNTKRISEVEYCISCYFNTYFVPVMNHEKTVLQAAQAKEVADYSNSFAGIMRTLAQSSSSAGIPGPDDTMQYLRLTGKECSKTAEDYVGMCKDSILGNKDFVSDLQRLAGEWRNAVVEEVGRKRYDELSSKLGTDLALAYVDHRIEQMMVDRMVRDQMPKDSFDFIIRKGASGSLFGLPQELMKSPLQREIEERGEAIYKPSKAEKGAAKGVSFASDVVAFGGVYSWGALARLAGAEVVFAGLESVLDKKQQKDGLTVDQCVSMGLFGGNGSTLSEIRKDSWRIKTYESGYIQSVNSTLSKKMPILKEKPAWEMDWSLDNLQNPFQNPGKGFIPLKFDAMSFVRSKTADHDQNFSAVPSVIAPGNEQEYLDWKAKHDNGMEQKKQQTPQVAEKNTEVREQEIVGDNNAPDGEERGNETQNQDNHNGWSHLLQSVGLEGIGDIGRNLPYVIAMLPDMLVGLFTGKTTSVNLRSEMMPLASILVGMFVRNPLLKMVLIGMGGANLINKMGHETIRRKQDGLPPVTRYRQYDDEELNPRISGAVIHGTTLIATIDNVPCSVTLPDNAAQAYAAGALPLNTLANAVLAHHDRMKTMAEDNYRNMEIEQQRQQERGILLR